MSSWDRQTVLNQLEARFRACEDEEALIEALGTPTKQAIELARTYVPTTPPSALNAMRQEALDTIAEVRGEAYASEEYTEDEPVGAPAAPEPEADPAPIRDAEAEEPEAPQTPRRRVKTGALVGYLIPAIIIGLPVTVALVCIGLPFLGAGAAAIAASVLGVLRAVSALSLVSDVLLLVGGGLAGCAVGLLAAWFGLWLSMELAHLWISGVLVALGEKLCLEKEETV